MAPPIKIMGMLTPSAQLSACTISSPSTTTLTAAKVIRAASRYATPLVEHRHPTVQLAIELLADGQLPPCVRRTNVGGLNPGP